MTDTAGNNKVFKRLYQPGTTPVILTVPAFKFATIDGKGDPNGEEFGFATAALYTFSYTVKMSYKSKDVPIDYYEYKVFPLEGEWDLEDKGKPISDKSNYKYKIMIRQPEFLTEALFERFLEAAKNKKPNPQLDKLRFEVIDEELCCQMLHVGSYDSEPASFLLMDKFCTENKYRRISRTHREIYLSDPRRTEASRLKTILRYKVQSL